MENNVEMEPTSEEVYAQACALIENHSFPLNDAAALYATTIAAARWARERAEHVDVERLTEHELTDRNVALAQLTAAERQLNEAWDSRWRAEREAESSRQLLSDLAQNAAAVAFAGMMPIRRGTFSLPDRGVVVFFDNNPLDDLNSVTDTRAELVRRAEGELQAQGAPVLASASYPAPENEDAGYTIVRVFDIAHAELVERTFGRHLGRMNQQVS